MKYEQPKIIIRTFATEDTLSASGINEDATYDPYMSSNPWK